MNDNGSVLPSQHPAYAREPVGTAEAAFAIGLAIAFFWVSLPLPELLLISIPQLVLLAVLAGALGALDSRISGARERALTATVVALILGVLGLALMRLSGFHLLYTEWLLAVPYCVGAGLACGTWVARPGTRFPRLLLRGFEAAAAAVVAYALVGLLLVFARS